MMVKKAEKITRDARVACEKWREYFHFNIDQYHDMHEFVLGHQWEREERDMLVTNKKIPLTNNKLATLGNYLLGEQQQNTPQLQVLPMSNASEEVAETRELIVKDITFSTDSRSVIQIAASQAIIGGFGAYLIDTDYTHSKSFDLDIIFRSFKDSTRCYWDVSADHPNKIDGMVCGYISRMSRMKFRETYGEKIEKQITGEGAIKATDEEVALATSPNMAENSFNWADDDSISILDHFVRKYEKDNLYKLSNGAVVNDEEMEKIVDYSVRVASVTGSFPGAILGDEVSDFDNLEQTGTPEGLGAQDMPGEVVEGSSVGERPEPEMITLIDIDTGQELRIEEKRPIKRSKIIHYKIAGDYILDESVFPGEDMPVIYVDQKSYYDKDGRQVCRSFFADVRDTQKYMNYLRTQSAYILKISRYDQFIGSKKNVQGNDTARNWRDPQAVQGLLTYDESPSGIRPEQLRPPELSASLLSQSELAMNDMYTSTGLYPTRMGMEGSEVSGAAINARSRQGSYATAPTLNSINQAFAAGAMIVNGMIPYVYDAPRVISLMSPSEGLKTLKVNQPQDEFGLKIENDIRKGTYEVRLIPGPSYEGQKQQALESLQLVLQANPQTFNLIADLYAENLPLANAIQIRNRLKTIVPPEILEAGKTGETPAQNKQPNPEEQMAVMQAQIKQKELQLKELEIQSKIQEQQMENERELARIQIEREELAAELEEQKLRYLAETQRTESDQSIAHANNLIKILTHKM